MKVVIGFVFLVIAYLTYSGGHQAPAQVPAPAISAPVQVQVPAVQVQDGPFSVPSNPMDISDLPATRTGSIVNPDAQLDMSQIEDRRPVQEETGDSVNPHPGYATCADDSGSNAPCYWDADKMGNGEGRSFWAEADGSFRYAS